MTMTALERILYGYALHQGNSVCDDPEYQYYHQGSSQKEQQLRLLLDSDGKKLLNEMLLEASEQHCVEMQHFFLATVQLCRELFIKC